MIFNRFVAFLIDVAMVIPAAVLPHIMNYHSFGLQLVYFTAAVLYFVHTTFSLYYSHGSTLGDKFMRLRMETVSGDKPDRKILLLRNTIFSGALYYVFYSFSWGDAVLGLGAVGLFLSLQFAILGKNKYNKKMTTLDLMLKTCYVKYTDAEPV